MKRVCVCVCVCVCTVFTQIQIGNKERAFDCLGRQGSRMKQGTEGMLSLFFALSMISGYK